MRIKSIQLSWFRGAADPVSLSPDYKSMVIYGLNGSGKSSFVDAMEYVLNDGKIGHLAHEYSGKHQEKAVPNTHRPQGRKSEVRITLKGGEVTTEIEEDGSPTILGGAAPVMRNWDYRRTVLRQDEVAAFIHDTKGGKYSALLPLLGLHQMEVAAENLRQLVRSVEAQSKLKETRGALREVAKTRNATFGTDTDDQILSKIEALHAKYCADKIPEGNALSLCKELQAALTARIAGSTAEQRRHVALQDAAALDLKGHVDELRDASGKLAGTVEPLIAERLEVLQSAGAFVRGLGDKEEVNCPACGRSVSVDAFRAHVTAEQERLTDVIAIFATRRAAIRTLCDTVKSLKSSLAKIDVKSWRDGAAGRGLAASFAYLDGLDAEALRESCGEDDVKAIETQLLPLSDAVRSACRDAPPDAQQLSTDRQMIEAGQAEIAAKEQVAAAERAEALVSFITSWERGVREELRLRSQKVIGDISADLQAMWAILHPGQAIEQVRLYLPPSTDKAIDIGLKFHGVAQDSPRLTLSEGYRNSLGLCIFLAMAKREAEEDRPLFLDDVVVSLDRNHRGMIVELLAREFSGRQVVILTHDRDWYAELRQQLDENSWVFRALLPWETPAIGIRWSHSTTTFGDARAQLKERPDSAGNDARKIMDVDLAIIAERLHIELPYLRADTNDRRMAHDFLKRFVADGKKCFQKKGAKDYQVHTEAIDTLDQADRLLASWANRGSHSFDLVRPEAAKLIDVCEKALGLFRCSSCDKRVWFADAEGSAWVQCQCGQIRWRYGKA
jgi:hypothetical protein